jgi:hypothetical protein
MSTLIKLPLTGNYGEVDSKTNNINHSHRREIQPATIRSLSWAWSERVDAGSTLIICP